VWILWNDLYRTRISHCHMIWLLPPAPTPSPVSKFSRFLSLSVCRRSSWLTGGDWGGGGDNTSGGEKAWSSINHPVLSGVINQDPDWIPVQSRPENLDPVPGPGRPIMVSKWKKDKNFTLWRAWCSHFRLDASHWAHKSFIFIFKQILASMDFFFFRIQLNSWMRIRTLWIWTKNTDN